MIYSADLHTHSTASDGEHRPADLVRMAKASGVEVLALTDHDTLDGLEEALAAAGQMGLRVLRGVELSAREYPTFHILGYGSRPDAPDLQALCRKMRTRREERSRRIIDFLREKGINISLEEVLAAAGGAVIGRPHFAQVMVRRGYTSTNREAFDRYLDTEEYHRVVERDKPSALECITAVKASGGFVSLAHPYQVGIDDSALERLVRELTGYGLDAIECFYPRHTPQQTSFYLSLAQKYSLHITGGSDFQGRHVKPDIGLTAWALELDWLLTQ